MPPLYRLSYLEDLILLYTPWSGSPLFPGTKGFNLERGGFWKRRLEKLRKAAVESSQKQIDEAVQLMTVLEAEVANALEYELTKEK